MVRDDRGPRSGQPARRAGRGGTPGGPRRGSQGRCRGGGRGHPRGPGGPLPTRPVRGAAGIVRTEPGAGATHCAGAAARDRLRGGGGGGLLLAGGEPESEGGEPESEVGEPESEGDRLPRAGGEPDSDGLPRAGGEPGDGGPPRAGGEPESDGLPRAGGPLVPPAPPSPAPPTLTATHLTVTYNGRTVLHDVGISVPAGQITAVVGPNGAGKSTLFHCLAGTLRPDAGRVRFGERDITGLPAHARTRLGVARTFQQLAVFPSLTIAENIRIGAEQGRVRDPAAVPRLLRLFGLRGERRAADLPTGILRRVELARALAGDPHVLLLDEPAAGLDASEVARLAVLLTALAADGTAVLVVEHDLDLVAGLADTVHVLAAGDVVSSGRPETVLDRRDEPSRRGAAP
ncbi:ABC transporter ATP-binding protein [Streptomyces citrinus]|uniref:ABC transporter ATP-binding protein n=1 Tax=Streptomyces citrinus TaxID=3118173 RepID=UPI003CC59BCD